MKHWLMTTILLATIMLVVSGCNEVEQKTEQREVQKVEQKAPPKCNSGRCYPGEKANSKLFNYKISDTQEAPETSVDESARREIMWNRAQILKNMAHLKKHCEQIKELLNRMRAGAQGSIGLEVRPIPVPIIPVPPDASSPRLPKTRINKSKKFTLIGPVTEPDGPTEPPCPPESKYKIYLV